MIDILIPVLGRPHRAAPLVQNIRAVTTLEHRIVFLSSRGDEEQSRACWDAHPDIVLTMEYPAGPGDYASKVNAGFHATNSDWVFMGADDLTFEPNWDTQALRQADRGPGYDIVGTNDLANAQVKRGLFGTHCLIRRRYITERGGTVDGPPGQVLHEGYDHNFVDRELCHTAQQRGVFVFAKHSRVKHSHYLWKTAAKDPTYRKALRHYQDDYRLFLSRAHLWNHVGLSSQERKMAA